VEPRRRQRAGRPQQQWRPRQQRSASRGARHHHDRLRITPPAGFPRGRSPDVGGCPPCPEDPVRRLSPPALAGDRGRRSGRLLPRRAYYSTQLWWIFRQGWFWLIPLIVNRNQDDAYGWCDPQGTPFTLTPTSSSTS